MSKRRKKNKKKHDLNKELLLNDIRTLKQSVADKEKEIEKVKHDNFKAFHVRNLKVFRGTCNLLLPFVVMSGITVGGFKVCNGGFPFYRDDVTRYKQYELECDKDNGINVNIEYVSYGWWSDSIPDNTLTLHTEALKEGDLFTRYKREYNLPDDSFDDLYDAVVRNDIDYIVEKYKDYKEERQTSNDLSAEEIEAFVEASLCKLDKDDKLIFPESHKKNTIITIVELIIALGIGAFITHVRDYDFFEDLDDIKDDYNSSFKSLEPLKRELEEERKKLLVLTAKKEGEI